MRLFPSLKLLALSSLVPLVFACAAPTDDGTTEDTSEDLSGSPDAIDFGFDGPNDQWSYYADFQKVDKNKGARLCHTYVSYGVGLDKSEIGDGNSPQGSRPYLEFWLKNAQPHCDEALIAFKAQNNHAPPSVSEFKTRVEAFANTDWEALTGFKGKITISPWNEPNNGGDAGNGLGAPIPADTAARFYMTAEKACEGGRCGVVAGDFATNGQMWKDLSFNCADDTVPEADLCKHKSSVNKANEPASYLDRYKNTIANEATKFGLPKNFRPEVMAYHGWHDENEFIADNNAKCTSYDDCAVRRLVKSLGGSWGSVKIWDTEDGISQDVATTPSDPEFSRGAAFMLCLHAKVSRRITRIYYTRLHRGSGQLLVGHTLRDGAKVLANRETSAAGFKCQ